MQYSCWNRRCSKSLSYPAKILSSGSAFLVILRCRVKQQFGSIQVDCKAGPRAKRCSYPRLHGLTGLSCPILWITFCLAHIWQSYCYKSVDFLGEIMNQIEISFWTSQQFKRHSKWVAVNISTLMQIPVISFLTLWHNIFKFLVYNW